VLLFSKILIAPFFSVAIFPSQYILFQCSEIVKNPKNEAYHLKIGPGTHVWSLITLREFGHFRTTSSRIPVLRDCKTRVIVAVFGPSNPLLSEKRSIRLEKLNRALMYGHKTH